RRRILPLARRVAAWRQRRRRREALERSRVARGARQLRGAPAGRRLQSGRGLYPRRHGAGPRDDGRGAAPHREGVGLIMPAMRYTFSAADMLSDELRAALRRRMHEIIGTALIAVAGIAA